MKKRILAIFLAVIMTATLLPATAQAAEELPKLPAPTDLEWGKYGGQSIPGCVSWSMTSHAGMAEILYHNVDGEVYVTGSMLDFSEDPEELMGDDLGFVCESNGLPSGSYYFTVQLIGDGETCADSDIARSATWTYTKPSAKLPTPAAPVFLPEGTTHEGCAEPSAVAHSHWGGTENSGYEVEFFYSASNANATSIYELSEWFGMLEFHNESFYCLSLSDIQDIQLDGTGAGYYYARVRALSRDINKTQNSNWSPLSTAFYYDGKVKPGTACTGTLTRTSGESVAWDITEMGEVTVDTTNIGQGETVLVGCKDDQGRFTGVKWLDADHASTQIDPATPNVKLFWLGANANPLSPSATVWGK